MRGAREYDWLVLEAPKVGELERHLFMSSNAFCQPCQQATIRKLFPLQDGIGPIWTTAV
jgi:hypothetical protein